MADSNCADCFRKVKDGNLCICHGGKDPDICSDRDCELFVPGGLHQKGVVELCKYAKTEKEAI